VIGYGEIDINRAVIRENATTLTAKRRLVNLSMILSKESSTTQEKRIRKASPFGTLKSWKLFRFIVKSNDDVRQEQFAMQLLSQISQIFKL